MRKERIVVYIIYRSPMYINTEHKDRGKAQQQCRT